MANSHSRAWYIGGGILILLLVALVAGRLYLNVWLPKYVNRVLNDIPGYEGSIEDLDIDLYRGAYRIHKLKVYKKGGKIPTPFIDIDVVDLSIQWGALFHGRIVSNADLIKPVINFAIKGDAEQNGLETDWTKPIKDLMPIDINLVTFKEGKLTYRDFSSHPEVDIYIHHMAGEAHNLRNVVDKSKPLPSTLKVTGDSIGGGKLGIEGGLNILKQVPDMDLNAKLEKVDLKALTDYTNAYASVDIRGGELNIYSEIIVKDDQLSGYVKPIATDVSLIDLRKSANPIKVAWETVVAAAVKIFTNHPKDQFATEVQLEGRLDDIHTRKAFVNIVRNAFVKAFSKDFDKDASPETPAD